jgi:signal peptidase complex subunit 1
MDFKGQKLSEMIAGIVVTVGTMLAFCIGYLMQDFLLAMGLFGGSTLVAVVATAFDWPFYNKHPIAFLPPSRAPAPYSDPSNIIPKPSKKKRKASWKNLWNFL